MYYALPNPTTEDLEAHLVWRFSVVANAPAVQTVARLRTLLNPKHISGVTDKYECQLTAREELSDEEVESFIKKYAKPGTLVQLTPDFFRS